MSLLDMFRTGPQAECYVCAARAGRQSDGDRCLDCTARLCEVAYSQALPLWTDEGATFAPAEGSTIRFDLFAGNTPVDGDSATPIRRDLQGWAA